MTKVLYSQSTQKIYSYPRLDDKPIIGLNSDFLILDKINASIPTYDPETQSVSSNFTIDLEELQYRQEWTVIDLSLEESTPNWDNFNIYMLSDSTFKTYRDSVRAIDADLNGALFDAYAMIDSHGITTFSTIWNIWSDIATIDPEDREAIAVAAESFSLPQNFIDLIRQ